MPIFVAPSAVIAIAPFRYLWNPPQLWRKQLPAGVPYAGDRFLHHQPCPGLPDDGLLANAEAGMSLPCPPVARTASNP